MTAVAANLSIFANFAPAEKVACGLLFPVTADEAGLNVFAKAPKVFGTYFDPIRDPLRLKEKKAAAKVVAKIAKGETADAVDARWGRKVRLHDAKALKAEQKAMGTGILDWLAAHPVRDLDVVLHAAGKQDGRAYACEMRTVALACPRLDGILDPANRVPVVDLAAHAGGQVILVGRWFGTKPPKAWLECRAADGRLVAVRLKVTKPYAFAANGKDACSVMDPQDGASEISVQLPLILPEGILAVVIDNGVGIAATPYGE